MNLPLMSQVKSRSGRHFLQIPGPTNVPERILRAIDQATIDHRGPEFAKMTLDSLERLKAVFKCSGPVVIYPASGSGAWEAAPVNTLSPGDRVLMYETGHFSTLWKGIANRVGLKADVIPANWRHGVDPQAVEAKLSEDSVHEIKAIAIVHNETSTGVTSNIGEVRKAIDRVGHPALLMVDTISSLGSIDYRQDEWGVDVTVGGSQKGLMLPPGLAFNALSDKALRACKTSGLSTSYWDWEAVIQANEKGFFPYTPATNLLFGLSASVSMLLEEGLENVFARHARLGAAARCAVKAWCLELVCVEPAEYSNSLTAVMVPEGHDADALRQTILEKFNLSLGNGLSKLQGKVFRIGHLGDFNELMLAGTLSGVEMGLELAGVPHQAGGVQAALEFLKK